jgi:hypothetical protein
MPRFMKDSDYAGYIKTEIKTMISGPSDLFLLRAEDSAISTITQYLGGIYDCTVIFAASSGIPDVRNLHIIKVVMALALFDLYHQTGVKDVPEHRKMAYEDAISWLKDAGRGTIKTTLPVLSEQEKSSDIRFNCTEKRQHKW